MSLSIIIALILAGIILLLLEVLVIPGVGIAGFVGFGLVAIGLYFAYQIDTTTGHITLFSTCIVSGISIYAALKSGFWDKASNHEIIDGKSSHQTTSLEVGMAGESVSRLAPIGKAIFNTEIVEVYSKDGYLDPQIAVKIVKIEPNRITVVKSENQ